MTMGRDADRMDARERERLAMLERLRAAPRGTAALEEALGDDSLRVREVAAEIAAERIAPERLVELLAAGGSFTRRSAAMTALVRSGQRGVPALTAGVRSRDPDRALFCIQVLGRIPSAGAIEELRLAARFPDLLLSQAALEALGTQRDAGSVPLLLEILQSDIPELEADLWRAISAVIALGRIGDARALPALQRLRGSELLRETVDEALSRIAAARPRHPEPIDG